MIVVMKTILMKDLLY